MTLDGIFNMTRFKNALNVHGGLNKNESIAIRAGGLTIEQLTAKCVRVAEGKEDPVTEELPDDMVGIFLPVVVFEFT